jgi:CheY-like chemotaxis protein
MNGEIGVESEINKGSEFWFKLKFEYSAEVYDDKLKVKDDIPENLRILYAEDNLVNQRVTMFLLQKINANCDIAVNGKEALEMFKAKKYDLILMDMYMPEMGGIESTRLIREFENQSAEKPVFIVAVTANAFSEDKQKCLDAGMDDFLSKPFKEAELMNIIKNAVGN